MRRRQTTIYDRSRVNEWFMHIQDGSELIAQRNELRLELQQLLKSGDRIPPARLIHLLYYGNAEQDMAQDFAPFAPDNQRPRPGEKKPGSPRKTGDNRRHKETSRPL